jgi:hypothetical protein
MNQIPNCFLNVTQTKYLIKLHGYNTRSLPGGKSGRCVGLTTLPPSCAVVMKSGNLNFLEPSGPLQACNGTALPFFLHGYKSPSKDLFSNIQRNLFICVIRTNKMHFYLLIYFNNYPLHISNRLTIHHQEAFYFICSIWYLSC